MSAVASHSIAEYRYSAFPLGGGRQVGRRRALPHVPECFAIVEFIHRSARLHGEPCSPATPRLATPRLAKPSATDSAANARKNAMRSDSMRLRQRCRRRANTATVRAALSLLTIRERMGPTVTLQPCGAVPIVNGAERTNRACFVNGRTGRSHWKSRHFVSLSAQRIADSQQHSRWDGMGAYRL